jgi:hypothetical protein
MGFAICSRRFGKKGQFYLIIAVLLISLTFGAVFSTKSSAKTEDYFKETWKNYIKEAPFAANSGKFEDFTQKFVEFARTSDKNFKLISVYSAGSEIQVYNAYGKTININNELSIPDSSAGTLGRTDKIGIITDSDVYYLDTPAGSIKAVFMTESKTAKRVYVYE